PRTTDRTRKDHDLGCVAAYNRGAESHKLRGRIRTISCGTNTYRIEDPWYGAVRRLTRRQLHRLHPRRRERTNVHHERRGYRREFGYLFHSVHHRRRRSHSQERVGGGVHYNEVGDVVYKRSP